MSSHIEKYPAEKIFFTSDLHFFHNNVLKYQPNRTWNTIDEMNEGIIENWNRKAPRDSITFVLGDLAMGGKGKADSVAELLSRINSKIYLVPGNHDNYIFDRKACMKHINVLPPLKEILVKDDKEFQHIVMCHFPLLAWHKSAQGSFCISGHEHNNLKDYPGLSMDIGIDTRPTLDPYSYYEIKDIMSKKQILFNDHHTSETTY